MGGPNLYDVLEVSASSSQDGVRRAYRRLAVRFHPDKNPGHDDQFSALTEAYEILGDKARRDAYDAFGMDGLRIYEGAFQLFCAANGTSGSLPPVRAAVSVVVGSAVLALLLALGLLLSALKYDSEIAETVPWVAVFTPIWLILPLAAAVGALAGVDVLKRLRGPLLRLVPTAALTVASLVLLCVRLEDATRCSWLAVVSPALISRGVGLAALPSTLAHRRQRGAASRDADGPHWTNQPAGATGRELVWLLLSAAQLSLVPAKLDGLLWLRWRLLLAPLWLWMGLEGLATASGCIGEARTVRAAAARTAPDVRALYEAPTMSPPWAADEPATRRRCRRRYVPADEPARCPHMTCI